MDKPDTTELDHSDLLIPLYTDAENALGLVATLEGGLDLLRTLTVESNATTKKERGIDGNVESSGFPLLKLGIGGKLGRTVENENNSQVTTESTDTLGSLLHRLRGHLQVAKLIPKPNEDANYSTLQAGDFVEFFGTFRENPLPSTLNTAERLLDLIEKVVRDPHTTFGKKALGQSSGTKNKSNQAKQKPASGQTISLNPLFTRLWPTIDVDEVEKYLPLIPLLREQVLAPLQEDLTTGVSRSYIVQGFDTDYRAVVTLLDDYVRNLAANEIDGREFRILGKVERNVIDDSDGVHLMRGSSLALFEEKVQPLLDDAVEKFKLPKIETVIVGPVLEILPIAVYV